MREIGVAYNDTPESRHALALARELAHEHGAALSAFEAVELSSYAYSATGMPAAYPVDAILAVARERLEALDGVKAHVVYGLPARELALYSASVDLLVIGSRGYGPAGRLVHGSTTRQLLRSARSPLLVVTRAALDADASRSEDLVTSAG
jgi:nucleotide-binding universal stress UspA family protein